MQKKDGKQGKNLKIQKLVLSKETIRRLDAEDLTEAVGGLPKTSQLTCDTNLTCTATNQTCSCAHVC